MAILLTGGTGKTGQHIARMLKQANIPFLLTSRKGQAGAPEGMNAVKFDWLDPTTYDSPFTHESLKEEKITAVYLIASMDAEDPTQLMVTFIDNAVSKHGVKRFVFMAGSNVEIGGPDVGKTWRHVVDKGYEYTMLCATWFMDTYKDPACIQTIKDEGKIYSACGNGKVPFVSSYDIGAAAFRVLTDQNPHNTDYRVLGGELLSLDGVAAKISTAINKPVEHVKLPKETMIGIYKDAGLPEHIAELLGFLEDVTAQGVEERTSDAVEKLTGRKPVTFDEFVKENAGLWK